MTSMGQQLVRDGDLLFTTDSEIKQTKEVSLVNNLNVQGER